MRGRKPKPTILKLLDGNPGNRKINNDEPKPEPLTTAAPVELSDQVSIEEWVRTIVPAIRLGQIRASDRVFAIAHCELWSTWRSQIADAAKHAHVVSSGKHHHPMPNPARCMANKTLMILAKVDAELGLTPTSRSRIKVGGSQDEEDRELAEILAIK